MKNLIRAAVLVAGAAGFSAALSVVASADVVEPNSPYQPTSVGMMSEEAVPPVEEPPAAATSDEPAKAGGPKEDAKETKEQSAKGADPKEALAAPTQATAVEATPAPETVVRQAPAVTQPAPSEDDAGSSAVARVLDPFRAGFQHIGASVGRVVSACEVGLGTGSGGPVLVLAVLSIATPFIRRRVIATRWTADDDVPELLYASELTPPG